MRWCALAGCLSGVESGPTRESRNTQPLELRFRGKVGDEPEVELALV